jgi:4-diphosphocytidyl-2-C-methyl-D-erythritol kinase
VLTFKSPAKLNIFLKVVGKRDNYHLINSRFIRYDKLFDEIIFEKKDKQKSGFEMVGNFDCKLENNTIFKAYKYLCEYAKDRKIESFFSDYLLKVNKNIPTGAGLGGGSSNAATFLLAVDELLNLKLKQKDFYAIGEKIGADVNFFISKYKSANVSGIGEKIEEFSDDEVEFKLNFVDIHANTSKVYSAFREHFFDKIDIKLANDMMKKTTNELLKSFDAKTLNDLLNPLLVCYPQIKKYMKEEMYLSGSGSTFFEAVKNG